MEGMHYNVETLCNRRGALSQELVQCNYSKTLDKRRFLNVCLQVRNHVISPVSLAQPSTINGETTSTTTCEYVYSQSEVKIYVCIAFDVPSYTRIHMHECMDCISEWIYEWDWI